MPCPSSERSERWRGVGLFSSSWSGSSGSEVKARKMDYTGGEERSGSNSTESTMRASGDFSSQEISKPLESSLVAKYRGPRLESSGEGVILTVRIIRISGSDRSRNKKRKRFFPRFLHESLTDSQEHWLCKVFSLSGR